MAENTTDGSDDKTRRRRIALEALAQFQKRGSIAENPDEVSAALADESDRASIIIMASLIEDVLADRILSQFAQGFKYRKDLLRQGGPPGSFVAKMQVALAMGLLTEDAVDLLELLRAMRNACAHSRLDINLKTPELKAVFLLAFSEETQAAIKEVEGSEGLRLALAMLYAYLLNIVLGQSPEQAHRYVGEVWENAKRHINEEHAKLKTSPEIPTEQ